jgi:hypothetical protein
VQVCLLRATVELSDFIRLAETFEMTPKLIAKQTITKISAYSSLPGCA